MAADLPDVYVRLHTLQGECRDDNHPSADGWVQIKGFNFGFGLTDTGGGAGKGGSGAKSGSGGSPAREVPLNFPDVSLTKSLDLASSSIWKDRCHTGKPIPKVELEACRYGGSDQGRGSRDVKIPFLHLVFEDVRVTSITLDLSDEAFPTETIKFTYECVKMESIWTDNASGDRHPERPLRVGWDKRTQKQATW